MALNALEDDLAELEHILKSSRGLLDRLDEPKNAIGLVKNHGISLETIPDFDSYHSIHFQLNFDMRIVFIFLTNIVDRKF